MIVIDFETASPLDLAEVGASRYAEHPKTRVLCMAYSHEGQAEVWWPGEPFPTVVREAAFEAASGNSCLIAHNAQFERVIWNGPLRKVVQDLPKLGPEAWRCTMSEAARYGWPLALGRLCEALDLPIRKDVKSKRVLFSRTGETQRGFFDVLLLEDYARRDAEVEYLVAKTLPRLDEHERRVWLLDQRINERGIGLDVEAARAIKEVVEAELESANRRLEELTGVPRATMTARLLAWCQERGVALPNLQAETLEAVLANDRLPESVREALTLRWQAAGSAVKKVDAMLACVCSDKRMRGLLQYYGAGATGRWAGRLVQPQNLPRPTQHVDPEDFVELTREELRQKYGNVLQAASDALRGLIVAGVGKKLIRADLSAIEARLVFWLAGHEDAMEIYRTNGDIYCEMASEVFGRKITKADKDERFLGKVVVLGCGYQMGAKRFYVTAKAAGLNITEERAEECVRAYRSRWHRVPQLWYGLQKACEDAVLKPGLRVDYGPVSFKSDGRTLCVKLPSGRNLYWQGVGVDYDEDDRLFVYVQRDRAGKWEKLNLFGGLITERIVQATARDVLVAGMFRAEASGLPVVLTVHDEIVVEVDEDGPDAKALVDCLSEPPAWAVGLPLAAEGEAAKRYGK